MLRMLEPDPQVSFAPVTGVFFALEPAPTNLACTRIYDRPAAVAQPRHALSVLVSGAPCVCFFYFYFFICDRPAAVAQPLHALSARVKGALCVFVCIHTHTHTHVCVYVYIFIHVYVHNVCVFIYIYTHTFEYMYAHTHTCMHTYKLRTYLCWLGS